MRVDRIVDFGTVVSLIGVDTETTEQTQAYIDGSARAKRRLINLL
jgi:hypothetical protein